MPILSIVTGDSITLSGVLEAETTISFNIVLSSTNDTLTFWFAEVTLTVLVSYPTAVILIVSGKFLDDFKTNEPSKSVEVPLVSPTTLILAPGIASFLLSVTEPEIVLCAKDTPQKNNDRISKYILIWLVLDGLCYQSTNIFDITKKRLKKINFS
jgi:hypothetical protein